MKMGLIRSFNDSDYNNPQMVEVGITPDAQHALE